MKVLVACEFSGAVRQAFRDRGHDAWSCDLLPAEDGSPYHIQGDVLKVLDQGWDLMIAHPPCTFLSRAGARWLYQGGEINKERLSLGMDAKKFFLRLLNCGIPRIAVENPTPLRIYELPSHSQAIQPYMFGHRFSKRTLLWLKGLPNLMATKVVANHIPYLPSNTGGKKRGQKCRTDKNAVRDPKEASKTFTGIAQAMAQQWG